VCVFDPQQAAMAAALQLLGTLLLHLAQSDGI
jgi:hypothetical protein